MQTGRKGTHRRAARSGGQMCPFCDQKRLLVEHHINGRDIPGWDMPWNKVYCCAACHDEVHMGLIVIDKWELTTEGYRLVWKRAGRAQEAQKPVEAVPEGTGAVDGL